MSEFDITVNDRLRLSPVAACDKAACVNYLGDFDVARWLLRVPHPYRDADFDGFLVNTQSNIDDNGRPLNYVVHDVEHGGIGGFGFETLVTGHSLEIGYWLAKPFWGHGIMTAVVGRCCEFAIAEWQVVRITANIFSGNLGSARVLEKNGFAYEGLLRKRYRKGDQYLDSHLYAHVTE